MRNGHGRPVGPIVMTEMGIALPTNRKGGIAYLRGDDVPVKGLYRRIRGQRAHRLIVEARTGIKLPTKAVVHHCNPNDKRSNRGPFVVCEDNAYHQLLETRTRALKECGNANWKKCRECARYRDPAEMEMRVIPGKRPGYVCTEYRCKAPCWRVTAKREREQKGVSTPWSQR